MRAFIPFLFSASLLSAQAQMSGPYTVDPLGGDFTTISAALTALGASGVSGPVTITIAQGSYTESLTLPTISGISAVNRVTLAGDGSAFFTELHPATAGPTINLADARYVTIEGLTIHTNSVGIQGDSPRHCTIKYCIILGDGSPSTKAAQFTRARDLLFSGSSTLGTYWGILVGSIAGQLSDNIRIADCVFNVSGIGIQIANVADVRVVDNVVVVNDDGQSGGLGLIYTNGSGELDVLRNRIEVNKANGVCMSINGFAGVAAERGKLTNNMLIQTYDSQLQIGMNISESNYLDVQHNSISVEYGFCNVAQVYSSGNLRIRSNILNTYEDGLMFFFTGTTGPLLLERNLYHDNGTPSFSLNGLGYSFAAWQGLGYDANSLVGDPQFEAVDDLHLLSTSPAIDQVPLGESVALDIDEMARPEGILPLSDIGCDEYFDWWPFDNKSALDPGTSDANTAMVMLDPAGQTLRLLPLPVSEVLVFEMAGRSLVMRPDPSGALGVSSLPAGTYIVRWSSTEGIHTQRVMIQR